MTGTLTLSESFVSDMDWEDTEVHVEEMECETICTHDSEPMDWEDIPQVGACKRSKVSEPVECNIPLQVKAAPPASKKGKTQSLVIGRLKTPFLVFTNTTLILLSLP
ncbi:hypothetical protein TNCT_434741 [Trichonephila clavata]|uniref:Uncharacterized protein n=1 Tax=Trichonephila clavata TaxID=2740835 RepID=A0A8X6JTG4_TRICU|nr:hypothetical protein TNCT_434741 [Trichonephila clavata]